MIQALQTNNGLLVDSILSVDWQIRFYPLQQIHLLLNALQNYASSAQQAVQTINILKIVVKNLSIDQNCAQQIAKLLLQLIRKYETDKIVIVESVAILRQLLQKFGQFVFATLKSALNDQNNTIFISLAAVVPQILNYIDGQEAVNFKNIVKSKLSDQDFLSPVTNGILTLVDNGRVVFLQIQNFFEWQYNGYLENQVDGLYVLNKKRDNGGAVIETQAVQLKDPLMQLIQQQIEPAKLGNPESLQILAAAAYYNEQTCQNFVTVLNHLNQQKMDSQLYDCCLEVLSYYLIKLSELDIKPDEQILQIFARFLNLEQSKNCQLSSQLHIARILYVFLQQQDIISPQFVADCFSYLRQIIANINQSKDVIIYQRIKNQIATGVFDPLPINQIFACTPAPVLSKVQRYLFQQIIMNLNALQINDVNQMAFYDCIFELKIACPISIFRFLAGRILEKYYNYDNKYRILLLTGAFDPQWRCRLQVFHFLQQNDVIEYTSGVVQGQCDYFETEQICCETVFTQSMKINLFMQLIDSVQSVKRQFLDYLVTLKREIFKVDNSQYFLSYLSKNTQDFINNESGTFELSQEVQNCIAITKTSCVAIQNLNAGTLEMRNTAVFILQGVRELGICCLIVLQCIIDVGNESQWRQERQQLEILLQTLK